MTARNSPNKRGPSTSIRDVEIPHDDDNHDDQSSVLSPNSAEQSSPGHVNQNNDRSISTSRTEQSLPGHNNKDNDRSISTSRASSCKLKHDKVLLKKDTVILSTYVKEEMYYGVKFIYDPKEDLATGGVIFNHFYKHCSKKLEGRKTYQTQNEKDMYVEYLWKNAVDDRVQQDSLAVKRSSVYTVMQNRFFCE